MRSALGSRIPRAARERDIAVETSPGTFPYPVDAVIIVSIARRRRRLERALVLGSVAQRPLARYLALHSPGGRYEEADTEFP